MLIYTSANRKLETNYTYSDKDIIKLESEYNIKLLGEMDTENELIKRDNDFNLILSMDSQLIDITSLFYELDAAFNYP